MSVESRTVVVTGATGVTGRAVCARLVADGHTVIAVGTDAARLASVDAAERLVAELTDRTATDALAADVRARHPHVDGLLHLVGGWKAGWSDEVTDWLNARLVTTLLNASEAFEPDLLAAPGGRLAIISSTAVHHDGPPSSAYAAAKLAAESWLGQLTARWTGTEAAATTFVVRELGDGEKATAPDTVAEALATLWDRPTADLAGARIRL